MSLKKQLLKVIEYQNQRHDTIVYQFPMTDRTEIMSGSQLVVREGQVAIFQKDGRVADVFAPGRHKLLTSNLPILTKLGAWAYGFHSPFKAEVIYVDTTQFTNQKWGTTNPITMRDSEFGGMVQIRGFGKYSFKVTDAKLFLQTLSGTRKEFTTSMIDEHLRSLIISTITDVIADSKIGVLDIASNMTELNEITRVSLQKHFENMGMQLVAFIIENVNFPDNVQKQIDKHIELSMLRKNMDVYGAKAQADALVGAASNPGMAGTMFGMGVVGNLGQQMNNGNIGMGVGLGMAGQPKGGSFCTQCGKPINANAKFCDECGAKQEEKTVCKNCKKVLKAGTKFCSDCGTKV